MYRELFRNRNYCLFLASQGLSAAGSALSSMGLLWYATTSLDSLSLTGLIGMAWGLPSFLGFLAGTIADRTDRRRLMTRIDYFSGMLMLLLAISIIFGFPSYVIVLFIFILSILREFFESASFAYLPSLVNKADTASANAFLNTSQQGILALARAIGGELLSSIGVIGLLIVDAISYLISAFSLVAIRTQDPSDENHSRKIPIVRNSKVFDKTTLTDMFIFPREIWDDLKAGISQMWSSPLISKVLPWALPANAAYGAVLVLLPGWVYQRIGGSAALYGFIISGSTVGFLLGALIAPFLARHYPVNWLMGGFTFLEAVTLLLFTQAKVPAMAITLFAFVGFFDGLSSPLFFSLLQVQLPEEYLGRIFGGLMTLLALGQPLGMALAGLFAEWQGSIFTVYAFSAIIIGLAGISFILARPLQVFLPSR